MSRDPFTLEIVKDALVAIGHEMLSSLPSFLGFIPSSRAICTWTCERPWRLRAVIQSCRSLGMRGGFAGMSGHPPLVDHRR
jgi:hypothetical protein